MKANELMVGDWVRNDLGENQQVVELREDVAMLAYNDMYSYDEFEPIPITPEILEKNSDGGFCYYDCPIIGYNGKRSTYIFGRASLYVEWERISMKPYIEIHGLGDTFYKNYVACVHELQHALRLCGIEKEIML